MMHLFMISVCCLFSAVSLQQYGGVDRGWGGVKKEWGGVNEGWGFNKFYGNQNERNKLEEDSELKMGDSWREDLAEMEERLSRLEKQLKEQLMNRRYPPGQPGRWGIPQYGVDSMNPGGDDSIVPKPDPDSEPPYLRPSEPRYGKSRDNIINSKDDIRIVSSDAPVERKSRWSDDYDDVNMFEKDEMKSLFNERTRNRLQDGDLDSSRQVGHDFETDLTYGVDPIFEEGPIAAPQEPTQDRDCDALYARRMTWDGVYDVFLKGRRVQVYCEFQKNGHNWLIIQRRINGEVDFYRGWEDYKEGFGVGSGESWLGLENLHQLTSSNAYVLRIELEDWDGNRAFAEYRTFSVGDERSNYRLTIAGYSGNAGDAMTYHNGRPFSTRDRPHDALRSINCAVESHGGWWYNACQRSNLNGKYLRGGVGGIDGVCWYYWKNNQYSMKNVTMKIRRA